jgi:hypothetical protein
MKNYTLRPDIFTLNFQCYSFRYSHDRVTYFDHGLEGQPSGALKDHIGAVRSFVDMGSCSGPLVVSGPGGGGKSTLMSYLYGTLSGTLETKKAKGEEGKEGEEGTEGKEGDTEGQAAKTKEAKEGKEGKEVSTGVEDGGMKEEGEEGEVHVPAGPLRICCGHFIGASPDSMRLGPMLRRIAWELRAGVAKIRAERSPPVAADAAGDTGGRGGRKGKAGKAGKAASKAGKGGDQKGGGNAGKGGNEQGGGASDDSEDSGLLAEITACKVGEEEQCCLCCVCVVVYVGVRLSYGSV